METRELLCFDDELLEKGDLARARAKNEAGVYVNSRLLKRLFAIEDAARTLAPAPTVVGGGEAVQGKRLIDAERGRQITEEGWTRRHDDEHKPGELEEAAEYYRALPESRPYMSWPWEEKWFKPTPNDRVRELVKAGALFLAAAEVAERKGYNHDYDTLITKMYATATAIDALLLTARPHPATLLAAEGYEKLREVLIQYVACNGAAQDEVFLRLRGKRSWTRAEFVEELRANGPQALDMMAGLMATAAYLTTKDKEFPHPAALLVEGGGERWISVEERLPENGQKVLVFNKKSGNTSVAAFHLSTTTEGYNWETPHYIIRRADVTHWQPLPAAPNDREEQGHE